MPVTHAGPGLTAPALPAPDGGSGRHGREYAELGFCRSGQLIDAEELARVRTAVEEVMNGRYATGREPLYRNWSPSDAPQAVVKVDLPHLCDPVIHGVVSDYRIGTWAAGVLAARAVQLWACELIYKSPGWQSEPHGAIGWHQDDRFWAHWEGEVFTIWLALTDVEEAMGPVTYVAGSHQWGPRDVAKSFFQTDLDEQRRRIGIPAGRAWREVPMTLSAGEASLHHRLTRHASGPNHGDRPRIGLALHLATERARLVPTTEPPFHTPDLTDSYACPVLTDPTT